MPTIDDLSVFRSSSQSGYEGDFLTVYSSLTSGRCAEVCRFAGSKNWHIRPFLIPSYMQGITIELIQEAVEKFVANELRKRQEALANNAFASYNFGDGLSVIASAGWQKETFDGKDDWTKVVYVACDDDPPGADSHRISFHAAFAEGSINLAESYAYWCENGAEIGFAETSTDASKSRRLRI